MSIILSYNKESDTITDHRKPDRNAKVFTVSRCYDITPERRVKFTVTKHEAIKQDPIVFKLNK